MVAVPGILSPISRASPKDLPPLPPDEESHLETLLAGQDELVAPLASTRTRAESFKLVQRTLPDFLHLASEASRVFRSAWPPEAVRDLNKASYKHTSTLVLEDEIVLGSDERETLMDVLESHRDMVEGLLTGFDADPAATYDLLLECSYALVPLHMFLRAIQLVLEGKTTQWNPTSIRLLTRLAHEAMTRVEDHFLLHDTELAERLTTRGPTVSLGEVKRQVGLSS